MPRWREWMPRVLLESALIVFSILLALAVDEWRQERRQEARLADARSAFAEEVRQNLDLLQSEMYLPRRERMWSRFTELGGLPSPTQEDLRSVWTTEFDGGVWPTPFRDAVWRSLSTNELMGRMPYADLFLLVDIYREQQNVDLWHERMFTVWMQPGGDRSDPAYIRDDIQRTRSYLADVVAAERRLVGRYEQALEQLTRSARGR
jgi:hypothetical protein